MRDLALKRPEPGKWQSAALAAGMHLLLGLFLFYSVRWQTSKPEAVQVELVSSMPVVQAPARPPPEPEVRKAPEPVVEPPPPPPRPDITFKEPPKPKPVPKPEPKPVEKKPEPKIEKKLDPKPAPPDTLREIESQERMFKEALARESAQQTQREASREADLLAQAAVEGARRNATNSWTGKISAKIRGNIVLPPGASGNPEAMFAISLLPDGSVVGEPKLRRSTGNPALDDAILRAIVKSSPLPKPDDPSVFVRNLDLVFRPLEQ
ncbi:MAG: TonB C-terminal domain-containing protein [Methyloversatilis sp.]|nr:TonB C-terminal domain-containing protein [Methyloversatilis sp.]MBP6195351.1 TonB C-terminal domain-containing protein [Methyloversatilis sp.]